MSEDKITITFECKACGGAVLELPDDYTDDSIAKCKSCGVEVGSWRDIKAKGRDEAKAYVTALARGAFKRGFGKR